MYVYVRARARVCARVCSRPPHLLRHLHYRGYTRHRPTRVPPSCTPRRCAARSGSPQRRAPRVSSGGSARRGRATTGISGSCDLGVSARRACRTALRRRAHACACGVHAVCMQCTRHVHVHVIQRAASTPHAHRTCIARTRHARSTRTALTLHCMCTTRALRPASAPHMHAGAG